MDLTFWTIIKSKKKSCQKIKELKIENLQMRISYFSSHTLTEFRIKLRNGKSTLQSTSKTIFSNLNSFFDIKVDELVYIYYVHSRYLVKLGASGNYDIQISKLYEENCLFNWVRKGCVNYTCHISVISDFSSLIRLSD